MRSSEEPAAEPRPSPRTRGLVGNSALLFGSRMVVAVLGWAGTLFVVRALSPDDWGRFTFVFGLLGLLSFASELGSNRVVLRRLTYEASDRGGFAGTYVLLRAALGLFAYALAMSIVVLANYPKDVVQATAVAGIVLLFGATSGAFNAVFEHAMNLKPVAVATVLGQSVQFALTGVVAFTRPSLVLFVLPAIAFDVVEVLWKLRSLRGVLRLRYRVRLRTWFEILREALPLAVGSGLALLYTRVDLLALSKLDTFEAVGRFGVALKFVALASFLPYALTTSLLPVLLQHADDAARYRAVVHRAVLLMAVAAGLVLVLFLPVAGDVIAALYGEEYRVAETAARITVATTCFGFVNAVALTVLIASGRNRVYVIAGLTGLVVNIIGNLLLIPSLSYEGAAITTAFSGGVLSTLLLTQARRVPEANPFGLRPVLPVGFAGLLSVALGVAVAKALPWPASAAVTVLVYFGLLRILRVGGPGGIRRLLRDDRSEVTS